MQRIEEVENAISIFPDERQAYLMDKWCEDISSVVNLTEAYVRNTIKFCKSLTAFKWIDKDEQLTMLKAFYPEVANVYMSFLYDQAQDGLTVIAVRVQWVHFLKILNFTK